MFGLVGSNGSIAVPLCHTRLPSCLRSAVDGVQTDDLLGRSGGKAASAGRVAQAVPHQAVSGTMLISPGRALTRRHLGRIHAHMRPVASSRAARTLLAAAAAALTLGAGTSPAAVAGWTVSPGGS